MKKVMSALFAAALVMGMPTLAFAANSPSNAANDKTVEEVEVAVTVPGQTTEDRLYIEPSDVAAANTPADAHKLADIEVTDGTGWTAGKNVTLSFDLSAKGKVEGDKVTVYIQHGNGMTDVQYLKVDANGKITLTVMGLSIFSIVDDWPEGVGEADSTYNNVVKATTDNSDTSPQTGVDMTWVAGIGVVAAVSACGVATLRRNVTE